MIVFLIQGQQSALKWFNSGSSFLSKGTKNYSKMGTINSAALTHKPNLISLLKSLGFYGFLLLSVIFDLMNNWIPSKSGLYCFLFSILIVSHFGIFLNKSMITVVPRLHLCPFYVLTWHLLCSDEQVFFASRIAALCKIAIFVKVMFLILLLPLFIVL